MYHPLKTKIKEMNSHEKSLIYGTDIIGDIQNVFHSPKGRGRPGTALGRNAGGV